MPLSWYDAPNDLTMTINFILSVRLAHIHRVKSQNKLSQFSFFTWWVCSFLLIWPIYCHCHTAHLIVLFLFFVVLRFKNVLFEISATETSGLFNLNAKFMGVNMEKVDLIFQVQRQNFFITCFRAPSQLSIGCWKGKPFKL